MDTNTNFIPEIVKLIKFRDNMHGKLCIFGAGNNGTGFVKELVEIYMDIKVDFYCDNYLKSKCIEGISIYDIDYIRNCYKDVFFIISIANHPDEIVNELQEYGYEEYCLINDGEFIIHLCRYLSEYCGYSIQRKFWKLVSDKEYLKIQFKKSMGRELNFDNPCTFNEKMQWIKVYDRKDLYTTLADKFAVRKYFSDNYGEEYLIPLIMHTDNPDSLSETTLPDYPFIIKTTANCHDYTIVRDKKGVSWEEIRNKYRKLLSTNFYYYGREWHYKNIKPSIIVEKLLVDNKGRIPNDYKLLYFNGKLKFIYCSVDREGKNYRKIYDENWEPMNFQMGSGNYGSIYPDIEKPKSFYQMREIGDDISKNMYFVRMDYYDVDGKMYFGEVTLCHGAGYDAFFPDSYDLYWGNQLYIPADKV